MAGFEPRVTLPLRATFRDAEVFAPIPPHGALTVLQALHMLDALPPAMDEAARWHTLAEVLKLAWRDRLRYLGDPDFADVPVARLLSRDYAAGRVEDIRQYPRHVDALAAAGRDGGHGTFHLSAADADGTAVTMTLSHGGGFGSGFVAEDTDLVLGHGMCRFDPRPGRANSVAPGKRPLNNAAPLLVRLPDRDVAVGLPGGRRIVSVMTEMARRLVEDRATGPAAARAPRLHTCGQEPLEVTTSIGAEMLDGLRAMGHRLTAVDALAGGAACAELLHAGGTVRAGGRGGAAGF
jgi:gamma-glutamyltranspeptidase/glutathione hydrolase